MHEKTKKIIEKILDTEQFIYTDDGTRTYRGIVYDLHAKKLAEKYNIHSWEELKQASDEVVIRFYYDEYIVPSHAEDFIEVSVNLAYQVADFAVNEGVSCAVKGIQKMYNLVTIDTSFKYGCIDEDGDYGSQTRFAISYIVESYNYLLEFLTTVDNIKHDKVIENKIKIWDKIYLKIRESHYFSKLAKIRKKYGDKKCMDFLQSWNRRCDFRFEE